MRSIIINLIAILALFVHATGSGIQISRSVKTIAPDTSFYLKFNAGCSSTDAYGSNDCSFQWGDEVAGSYEGKLGHDLEAGSTIAVNLKVDKVINFAFNCAACGANCTFAIPVINEPTTVALPPCPIPASTVPTTLFDEFLPKTSPTKGVKVTAVGTIEIIDAKKESVLNLYIDATVQ